MNFIQNFLLQSFFFFYFLNSQKYLAISFQKGKCISGSYGQSVKIFCCNLYHSEGDK